VGSVPTPWGDSVRTARESSIGVPRPPSAEPLSFPRERRSSGAGATEASGQLPEGARPHVTLCRKPRTASMYAARSSQNGVCELFSNSIRIAPGIPSAI